MEIADHIKLSDFWGIRSSAQTLELSERALERVRRCNAYLLNKIDETIEPIYGINTGFGALCHTSVDSGDLVKLQLNLLRSHACGTGEEVPGEIVRTMLLLKVISLSKGYSGVQEAVVNRLLEFYNNSILPRVFQQGSLGASGDLAPLAHLALPLIGEGQVYIEGKLVDASVLGDALELGPKEGLALINGTQFMLAYALHTWNDSVRIAELGDLIGALSLDVFNGRSEPFLPESHAIRPHPGQINSAARILDYLKGSELQDLPDKKVQDPYSFRCMPQVHGASHDVIMHCGTVFERELNAVTDNPNVFPEEDMILSAGNFHGQPLALHLDFLGMALAELGSISERRGYQLLSGTRGLPAFLAENAGLESGMMILQYTAASIASQNKQLSVPCSTDSQLSSNGQEDHVSMGANSATKTLRIVDNCYSILAIELLMAGRALEMRRPKRSSGVLERFYSLFRSAIPHHRGDMIWSEQIRACSDFLRTVDLSEISSS
ncbi:MAG: histidine ammonia-lyase [Flavobacteriales bacterium]|nr:histidine ammonia-lyase [Flavobacteriales bacterium]